MDKPCLTIVKYNNYDIIATSLIVTPSTDPSVLPIIWLDLESIKNYNDFSKKDTDLRYLDGYMYFGYSGAYDNIGYKPSSFYPGGTSVAPEQSIINHMDAGEAAQYYLIREWLSERAFYNPF